MDALVEALWHLPWRAYPGILLVALGLGVLARALRRELPGIRLPVSDPHKGIALTRALRGVLVGLAVAGIGVAWTWQLGSLFGLCCIIGGEETLETSVVIAALDDAERKGVWRIRTPAGG
jgi:hypothetical protein